MGMNVKGTGVPIQDRVDRLPCTGGWEHALIQASHGALLLLQVDPEPTPAQWDAQVLQGTIARSWGKGVQLPAGASLRHSCPALGAQWPRAFAQVLEGGKAVRLECERIQPGRWTQVDVVPVDRARCIVGLLAQDITSLKQREIEVAERKHHYRSVIDRMPLPIWGVNAQGQVQYVNSRFDTFFGMFCSSGKVAWVSLIHPEDCEHFMLRLHLALDAVSDFSALVRGRRADGQWRWLEVQASACFSARGDFIGLDGSFRDVTDHQALVQARDELLESERAARINAETSTRLKDEFLATLSHEMRTPLTTVLGWSELLLQRADGDAMQRRGLSVICSSAETLSRLISDMLDLSGMLVGKLYLDMQPINLGEQLREVVTALGGSGRQAAAIALDLPRRKVMVLGDRARLSQVFWNLLSNAGKFTSHMADGHIQVVLSCSADSCRVQVRDNGTGIAPEFLPHLFDRFSQADASTTRRHGGLGLGLAIVQQLVSLHGGKVAVSSEGLGRGSCFEVLLPLQAQAGAALDGPASPRLAGSPLVVGTDSTLLQGCRLLLVDDQADILEYLGQALTRHGAVIERALSGNQALQLIAGNPPGHYRAVLSDISMPGMDGFSLARVVRQDLYMGPEELPLIAVTALARESDRLDALANGFQAVVTKPFNLAELVGELVRCCRPQPSPAACSR